MVLKTAILIAILLTVGCGSPAAPRDDARVSVVAAFGPLAEAAERIGGDEVLVTNLTPAGAEPHDIELSTDDLDAVLDADVVLYLRGFQPSLDEAIERSDGEVVDLLDGARLLPDDPHIWLDPVRWNAAVQRIGGALDADVAELRSELRALDDEMSAGLRTCERRDIVTTHAAFGYLADRYNLTQHAISGVSPEAEPDPRRLSELADLVEREGVTTVFTEALVSPKVAEALADEAGVATAVLDPIEGRPRGGYVGAQRRNLATLRDALDCR